MQILKTELLESEMDLNVSSVLRSNLQVILKNIEDHNTTIKLANQLQRNTIGARVYKRTYDPKLNSKCLVQIEKFDVNLSNLKPVKNAKTARQKKPGKELNKHSNTRNKKINGQSCLSIDIESSNKSTATTNLSEELQNNDFMITAANDKLLHHDFKLYSQCLVRIQSFDFSMGSNQHIESCNESTALLSSQGQLNNDNIVSTTRADDILLCHDSKINVPLTVQIEKFNMNMKSNELVKSSSKMSAEHCKLLCHDPKLNLRCMVLIKRIELDNLPNNVTATCWPCTDNDNINSNKINWKNISECNNENPETDCKIQNKISKIYFTTKKTDIRQAELSKCINKCTDNKKKIYSNQYKSAVHLGEENSAEVSLNKSNEVAITNFIFKTSVPIYKAQHMGDNKASTSIDLYQFDEKDSDGIKTRGNGKYSFNNTAEFNKSMYILRKINMKKKSKVKNNERNRRVDKMYNKYNKTIEGVIQKIMSKVYARNGSENERGIVIGDKEKKNIHESEILPPNVNCDDSATEDNNEFFDFNDGSQSAPSQSKLNINVISNTQLNSFNDIKASNNSATLCGNNYSPWRFCENVTRNPHFIIIKKSALPCLQQDMVLDYIQLEKIERHFSKSEKKPVNSKVKPVQKSIRDFVSVSSDINNRENIPHSNTHSNLFDYDDFSSNKVLPQFSKNNVVRGILASRQYNGKNVHANEFPDQRNHDNSDIDVYSGFNDVILSENKTKTYENIKRCTKEVTPIETLIQKLPNLEDSIENESGIFNTEMGLFEDPEQDISVNVPSKIYGRKRQKRKLLFEESDEHESKSKMKNTITKEKEAETERWAAEFNGK